MGLIEFKVMQGNHPPNPGGQTNSKACSRPNPPWWCEENEPNVSISGINSYLILTAMVIALFLTLSKKQKK